MKIRMLTRAPGSKGGNLLGYFMLETDIERQPSEWRAARASFCELEASAELVEFTVDVPDEDLDFAMTPPAIVGQITLTRIERGDH